MRESGRPSEISAVVADDESLARRRVMELLKDRADVRVVAQCANGRTTLEAVRRLAPDLLFLDVQMPALDGFEVLAELRPEERPVVIFSTAYDEYALAAFEVHAVDYLLKPYADERLGEALARAQGAIRGRRVGELQERIRELLREVGAPETGSPSPSPDEAEGYLEQFAVPSGEEIAIVDAGAVDWIEADGDYVSLHVGSRTHLLRATMTELERRLDPRHFLRIHRSTIVQLDRVRQLRSDDHGDYVALLAGGKELRVSRSYRDVLLRRLGLRM